MRSIAIALPAAVPAVREEKGLAVREIDDPDLYVRYVNDLQRRKNRTDARRKTESIVRFQA